MQGSMSQIFYLCSSSNLIKGRTSFIKTSAKYSRFCHKIRTRTQKSETRFPGKISVRLPTNSGAKFIPSVHVLKISLISIEY